MLTGNLMFRKIWHMAVLSFILLFGVGYGDIIDWTHPEYLMLS